MSAPLAGKKSLLPTTIVITPDIVYTKAALHHLFRTEKDLGIVEAEIEGDLVSIVPGYGPFGVCTNSAKLVADRCNGIVCGFFAEDNPVDSPEITDTGGHDFAVVSNRFIVDPWIVFFVGEDHRIVLDVEDQADHDEIVRRYGDPFKWKIVYQSGQEKTKLQEKGGAEAFSLFRRCR